MRPRVKGLGIRVHVSGSSIVRNQNEEWLSLCGLQLNCGQSLVPKTSEVGTEGVIYTHVVASLFCVHATAAKASSRRSAVVLSSMRNLRFVSQHRLNHV